MGLFGNGKIRAEEFEPPQVATGKRMAITEEKGKVPPQAMLLQQIASVRGLLTMPQKLVVGPVLDTFAAYIAATEGRLAALERNAETKK